MHLEFFGMSETPFPTVALSEHFYGFHSVQSGLNSLENAIVRSAGPCLVIGAAGTGKSMLLSVLAKKQQGRKLTLTLANSRLCTRRALLQSMLFELGIDYKNKDEGELRLTLTEFLKNSDTCPNGVLVLIDEAHTLPLHLLDELRVLTNLVRNGHAQIQLILAGNSNLEESFADPSMESFNQRIACRAYLNGMGRDELPGYIAYQLKRVHSAVETIFNVPAMNAIHTATCGIPRLVNQLCDFTLVCAFEKKLKQVDENFVQWVWSILQQIPSAIEEPISDSTTDSPAKSSGLIIEFGSLDDEPTSETTTAENAGNVSGFSKTPLNNDAFVNSKSETASDLDGELRDSSLEFATASSGESKTQTFGFSAPSQPSTMVSQTASSDSSDQQESNTPTTFITFAFEQNIQKPQSVQSVQEPSAINVYEVASNVAFPPMGSVDTSRSQSVDSAPSPISKPTGQSTPQEIEVPVSSIPSLQKMNDTLDTISYALDSLDDDWNTVDQVIAEAELHQSIRPMLDQTDGKPENVQATQSVRSIDESFLFNDHMFDETEIVSDTAWTRFIQAPALNQRKPSVIQNFRSLNVQTSQSANTKQSIRIDVPSQSSVDTIAGSKENTHELGWHNSNATAPKFDSTNTYEITQAKVSFGNELQDDRSIIRPASEDAADAQQYSTHSTAAPPAARRKDLRALLTALRGY